LHYATYRERESTTNRQSSLLDFFSLTIKLLYKPDLISDSHYYTSCLTTADQEHHQFNVCRYFTLTDCILPNEWFVLKQACFWQCRAAVWNVPTSDTRRTGTSWSSSRLSTKYACKFTLLHADERQLHEQFQFCKQSVGYVRGADRK